ncbi:MAG TPA: sugar phosphate isomerase/epimerase, partial [Microlunatus sp.]|nr:sugar phosphate isomerase/epimerase [Microlunatus sp.]
MISIQLWSLRDAITGLGWGSVLDAVAAAGYRHVEPFGLAATLPLISESLTRNGLTIPTAHGDLTGDDLAPTLEAAAGAGVSVIVHPSFTADRWREADGIQRIAADLNHAAEAAGPHGMSVAFHNHDDDLAPGPDGRPGLVALMDHVAPSVGVEFDPHWATVAGADVLATLTALGPRVLAVHLKDGPRRPSHADQAVLGEG